MKLKKFEREFCGRTLKIEIGKLAGQANGSVQVQYGDTTALATCVMSEGRSGGDFFPLTVNYEERFYAAGRIKGSRWIKREGRPTDEAILTGRVIDRAIRPLFNQKMRQEVQVIVTILSIDGKNDPDIPGLIGTSLALAISDIPWGGPIGAIRIGKKDGAYILNPDYETRDNTFFDILITGLKDNGVGDPDNIAINMIEGGLNQVPEEEVIGAIEFSKKHLKNIIRFQNEIIKGLNPQKVQVEIMRPSEDIKKEVRDFLATDKSSKLEQVLSPGKAEKETSSLEKMKKLDVLKKDLTFFINGKFGDPEKTGAALEVFEETIDQIIHKNVLGKKLRPDGRKLDEIREITTEAGLLPRTHGSGLFQRGATQALSILTLASPGLEQYLEGMEIVGRKRFMHHYNFLPFSTGEIGAMRGPGRREIGHGALVEKALLPVIPTKEEFPYTIRIVSEILSSNGSTSMASVCGSTLALLDAGVPIKANVAGIAMGLIQDKTNPQKYEILTDIQGPEDHHGDMDLKTAGTKNGITALQMDVKIKGINIPILKKTLEQARIARLFIFKKMEKTISRPREELSPFAPRVMTIKITPEKIRDVIGPGGRIINEIITSTGADIDIEDDGMVFVTAEGKDSAQKAIDWIKGLTREVKPGEIFKGKVTRIMSFGVFVEILPRQEGLLHISELTLYRSKRIEDLVHIGDIILVKVKNIDDLGRINLCLAKKEK